MTIKDSYPISRIDYCIDSLGNASVFTTLDAYSGSWQVATIPEDRHKSAFLCHAGQLKYVRMPFWPTNAPKTFPRTLDMILSRYKWKTCLVYIDDVIIYSKPVEEHISHAEEVLTALKKARVKLKMDKCTLFSDSVKYLGHVIKADRLEIYRTNIASLRDGEPHKRGRNFTSSWTSLTCISDLSRTSQSLQNLSKTVE